jgi:hypothetical protein
MIRLYSPDNEPELAVIRSLLMAEGIHYYVLNDHFGTLKTGPKIDLLNAKTVYVSKEDLERARDLLTDFLSNIQRSDTPAPNIYSTRDKLRMVLETLIFGWFIPGNRWRR